MGEEDFGIKRSCWSTKSLHSLGKQHGDGVIGGHCP